MKLTEKFGQLGSDIKALGPNASGAWTKLVGTGEAAGKGGAGVLGALGTLAKQPLKWGIDGARLVVNTGNYALKNHGRLTIGATALAAAVGVGSVMRNGAVKKSNAQLADNARAMQASYMNSVSAEESARMDAAMKQGGQANFAEAAQQQRSGVTTQSL